MMAGCYIPIDIPDIISKLIFPNFGKGHTSPFKSRMVLPRKDITG